MFVSMTSGMVLMYFLYLGFRKPQASMQQSEDLAITLTSLDDTDLAILFGNDVFVSPGLRFLQSLILNSSHPYFGGWSGVAVTDNETRLIAVSDSGHWLETDLLQNNKQITAMNNARIGPLRDDHGKILRETGYGDIEAIGMDDKQIYLAFESYRSGIWSAQRQTSLEHTKFKRWQSPADMARLPIGRGLEALSILDGTRNYPTGLLAFAERDFGKVNTHSPAWHFKPDQQPDALIHIGLDDDYEISDAAFHPQCGLFLLERKLTAYGRFYVRLLKLEAKTSDSWPEVSQQQLFEASSAGEAIDNMEALAVVPGPAGECHLYLLSDSNFLPIQKTVLLKFGYRP